MMAEKKQLKNILSQGSHATEAAETSKTAETAETAETVEAIEAAHQFSEQAAGLDKQIDKLENRRSKKEPLRAEGNLFGQRIRVLTEKLLTRSLSGAIYAIIVLACLYVGHDATTVLIAATGWVCCSEFFHICRLGGRMPNEPLGLTFAVVFPRLGSFWILWHVQLPAHTAYTLWSLVCADTPRQPCGCCSNLFWSYIHLAGIFHHSDASLIRTVIFCSMAYLGRYGIGLGK